MVMPPPIRPTFDHRLQMSAAQVTQALRQALEADGEHPFQIRGRHVVVTVPQPSRHFWSPHLTIESQDTDGGAVLHGRFSPRPAIWTGFMLSYIALTTAGCFGLMFAGSLMMIGHSPAVAVVLTLVFLLASLGLYIASQVGQRLARDQMDELHALIAPALGLGPATAGPTPPQESRPARR